MMAQTIGADLEGDYDADGRTTSRIWRRRRIPVVFDEVGYYVVPGMDKMLAMGRGLGFMFYLGFQEVAGLRAAHWRHDVLAARQRQPADPHAAAGGQRDAQIRRAAPPATPTSPRPAPTRPTSSGVFRESMSADVRQTARVNWSDLRGLIEGEAIILLGKDRVYAKLFYAEIDARGPMRMNRPLMLRPPEVGRIKQEGERTERTRGHLLAGRAAVRLEVAASRTLDSLLAGFAHRVAERLDQDFGTTAHAAILALTDVAPSAAEAWLALGPADGATIETEHTLMARSVSAPAKNLPTPDAPRARLSPEASGALTEINQRMGASPPMPKPTLTKRWPCASSRWTAWPTSPRCPPLSLISSVC